MQIPRCLLNVEGAFFYLFTCLMFIGTVIDCNCMQHNNQVRPERALWKYKTIMLGNKSGNAGKTRPSTKWGPCRHR